MTLTVTIEGKQHDLELSERTIAMLLAHNVRDPRLQHNVKAYWANPHNPQGLIRFEDEPGKLA